MSDTAWKTRKALLEKRARNEVNAVLNAFSLCQKITQRSYDKICLLTDLGQAGRENIWLSVRTSQIFSRPVLPLSQ